MDDSKIVDRRFVSVAQRYAPRPALAFRDTVGWAHWTYQRLSDRARQMAIHFRSVGVQPGEAVGLIASRHPDTIAAMLAILESKAHYVPLDPTYPRARIRLLCEEAGVKHIFSAVLVADPQRFPSSVTMLGATCSNDKGASPPDADHSRQTGESPAYILFTSGSTGEPKGVVVPHRAIVRLIDNQNFMRLGPHTAFLHLSPMSFDASTLEIWGPLLNGGTCVLYPDGELPTASGLKAVVEAARVNAIWLTASLFNSIIDHDVHSLAGVNDILTGGEALSVPHVCRALAELKDTQLVNGYGPTENTTFTTCYRIPATFSSNEQRVPIGVPISGTEVLIVDDQLKPVPQGTSGELIATGEGLALGYLNRPALTRERFVAVERENGATVLGYRTGDQVAQRADGLIEFLGRFDDQLKIEGFRIEPAEIERAILGLPGVNDCRVLVVAGPKGQKRLTAYVATGRSTEGRILREELGSLLPGYMMPHHMILLERLPINSNGKLDRTALPNPYMRGNPTQRADQSSELAAVGVAWEEVLGRRPPSEDLGFFDAGGTSLDAMRLLELLCERFSRPLDPTFVFEHPTIQRQAEALKSPGSNDVAESNRGRRRREATSRATRRNRR